MFKQKFDAVLVVKGAEYSAVRQGIQKTGTQGVTLVSIPMGVEALQIYLSQAQLKYDRVLLLGLAGSLNPLYSVGDIVVYENCCYQSESGKLLKRDCNYSLDNLLQYKMVKGLTCDRLLHDASAKTEKRMLSQADVVDMESWLILNSFPSVTIVRVISDNYEQSLPNLNSALNNQGNLQPIPLTLAMLQKPLSAVTLIRGSLKALKVLEKLTTQLFSG